MWVFESVCVCETERKRPEIVHKAVYHLACCCYGAHFLLFGIFCAKFILAKWSAFHGIFMIRAILSEWVNKHALLYYFRHGYIPVISHAYPTSSIGADRTKPKATQINGWKWTVLWIFLTFRLIYCMQSSEKTWCTSTHVHAWVCGGAVMNVYRLHGDQWLVWKYLILTL